MARSQAGLPGGSAWRQSGWSVLASLLTKVFPARVRYGSFALSFNLGNALFGGTAPFIATFLVALTGTNFASGYYLTGAAVVAFVALLFTTETAGPSSIRQNLPVSGNRLPHQRPGCGKRGVSAET